MQSQTVTPAVGQRSFSADRSQKEQLLQEIRRYVEIGGGPETQKKRDREMERLMKKSGKSKQDIDEVVTLFLGGAPGGARRVVEGWVQ